MEIVLCPLLRGMGWIVGLLQLAIFARVILSWVDQNPFSSNPIKDMLYSITEPIMAPLRRVIPPIGGMLDISPIAAILGLAVLQSIVDELAAGAACSFSVLF